MRSAETLETIQTLLLKLIHQEETSLRIQDVSLALLQDTLAEARAGRKVGWEQLVSRFKEKGFNTKEISKRFEEETVEAKDFAYGTAKEIKSRQKK